MRIPTESPASIGSLTSDGCAGVTVSCYICGFIGDQDSEKAWLAEKVDGYTHSVEVLDGVARRNPHTAYDVLQKSLQHGWDFVQCITPHIREIFHPVE